jgi:hypothetical protein
MSNSICAKLAPHLEPAALAEVLRGYREVRRARQDPVAFAEFAFTDESGKPMKSRSFIEICTSF